MLAALVEAGGGYPHRTSGRELSEQIRRLEAELGSPVVDRFAFITRRNAHLSPATRAFMELAAKRLEALGRRTPAAD